MAGTTTNGVPYPDGGDTISTGDDKIREVAAWIQAHGKGPEVMTTVQRDALNGANLWGGKQIWNSDDHEVQIYDAIDQVWDPQNNTLYEFSNFV